MRSTIAGLSVLLAAMARLTGAQLNATADLTTSPAGITGSFNFYAETADDPLEVTITLSGLQSSNDKGYLYHIHRLPINSTGSCASAGPHLDPTFQGSAANNTHYTCDPEGEWDECELGDLSGKHGRLFANTVFPVTYEDDSEGFADPDMPDYYILGRSVVLHDSTGVRIACGNITDVGPPLSSDDEDDIDDTDDIDDSTSDTDAGSTNSTDGIIVDSNSNGTVVDSSSSSNDTNSGLNFTVVDTSSTNSITDSNNTSNGAAKAANATTAPLSSLVGVKSGSGRTAPAMFGFCVFAAVAGMFF